MKREKLYDSLTNVDGDLIEAADSHIFRRKKRFRLLGAVAAVLAVAILAGVLLCPGSSPLVANANAIAEIVKDVKKTGSYAGTAFDIHNHDIAKSILVTDNSKLDYGIAIEYEKGRIIAIGDSSITGDGTNFLGIKLKNAGYKELDNKTFLINAMEWLRHSKK